MSQEELTKLQDLIVQRQKLDAELKKFQREVTLMFTDIVGSTSYFDRFGDVAGLVYVHRCNDMLIEVATRHGGTICKTIGDAVMSFYLDPQKAVKAAVDMQRTLEAYNKDQVETEQIFVRIGLNYGPGMIKDKDVFGDVVNVAARIEALAKKEQIFISDGLEQKIRDAKIPVRQIPDVAVKGKAEKLVVYEVLWKETKAGAPVEMPTTAPTVAARVPVAKAAEPTSEQRGTVVMGVSPVAAMARPSAKVQYSLVVVRPDGTHGQPFKLEEAITMLGRVEGEIRFPDDSLVSRRHARFTLTDKGVAVEDLKSANGIFYRLRASSGLQDNDVILMGRQMFRFCTLPADGHATPPPAAKGEKGRSGKFEMEKLLPTKAELVRLLPGGVEENHYPLVAGENILGRTRGTVTFPEDSYLSSQHAAIKYDGAKFVIEDLNSGNGTFVEIRERTNLTDGDIILIGHQLLRITATPT